MIHTDEETGRLYVDGTPVFARLSGGTLCCMVRTSSEAVFDAVALQIGLLRYENPARDEVLGTEGEVVQEATPASGNIIPATGVTITRLGPHVITPGEYEDGEEVVAPVIDNRYHVNFWLSPSVVEAGNWETWAVQWMQSNDEGTPNKSEASLEAMGIELIDPLTVSSPSNVLL